MRIIDGSLAAAGSAMHGQCDEMNMFLASWFINDEFDVLVLSSCCAKDGDRWWSNRIVAGAPAGTEQSGS